MTPPISDRRLAAWQSRPQPSGVPSPDPELLSQAAARELLERAGEIDSDTTSVDTLRVAAREAGISDAAFEAALVEMRGRIAVRTEPTPSPWRRRFILTIVAGAMLLFAGVVVIPRLVGAPKTEPVTDHDILVQCLPMRMAQDIAQKLMTLPDNEVQLSKGSRVLRVRATAAQIKTLQSIFDARAKSLTACDNSPPI